MEDVLDFSADFWERKLDLEPESVDNIYSKKGISYAIDDYCGFDPVAQWMQTPPEETGQLPDSGTTEGRGKRRAKAKSVKRHSTKS